MAISKNYYTYFPLEVLLNDRKVTQLKDMALSLGLHVRSGVKKADLVRQLGNIMLENPELILQHSFYYELKAFLDVAEDRLTVDEADWSGLLFELNRFVLLYALDNTKKGESTIYLQKDIAKKLLPLIPDELERREKDGSLLLEKVAIGFANLYGYTEFIHVFERFPEIEEELGMEFEADEFLRMSLPLLTVANEGGRSKSRVFRSPFAVYTGFEPSDNAIDFRVDAKKFDLKTALAFGEMPYPKIDIPETEPLRKVIDRYGNGNHSAEYIIRDLWIYKQDERVNSSIPDISSYFRIENGNEVNECLDAVVQFLNNVPFWRLRGNSSEEMLRKSKRANNGIQQRPRIVMGPNMRAMGIASFEQLEEMAARGEELPPFPVPTVTVAKKVGRNEPCPCGSGKKYKNCCGKN